MLSPMNSRELNRASGIIASAPHRISTQRKTASKPAPIAIASEADDDQPSRPVPMVNPQVNNTSEAAASKAPARSSGVSPSFGGSRMYATARAIAAQASGMLRRNISRQPTTSISQPPSTGPVALPIELAADQVPTARPRASPE